MEFKFDVIKEAMDLQGISFPKLANLCGSPESTLKKLARGEISDPRLSTLLAPFRILGLSIDRACGLAPERDMKKEPAFHDATMLQSMQERMSMQTERITTLSEQLGAERERANGYERMVREKDVHLEDFRRRVDERQATINRLARHSNIIRYAMLAVIVVMAVGLVYFAWEIANIDKGLTGMRLQDYLNQ